jgi:hypothetical protein
MIEVKYRMEDLPEDPYGNKRVFLFEKQKLANQN